ncbi:MAG TPA: glycosyltransferase [Egibacteraceae bacterium]|nr:glycosyltransferase [Egibacteraceae bacterium]
MKAAAVIAAWNEAPTIAEVVGAARASVLVDEVIVVDGRSTDGTAAGAEAAGARVLTQPEGGKGEAMAAGVAATDADVIVFLDGDLTGLRPHHVDRLVRTVTAGGAVMACGLFDRGPGMNRLFLHLLPILTGERALRRELFESLAAADLAGYRIEAALNARAGELGLPVAAFVCQGMWHRTKEEKFSTPAQGWIAKVRMLLVAMGSYAGYWARRRLRASA